MKPELKDKIKNSRQDYTKHQLLEENINSDPFIQFGIWLHEAFEKGDDTANAFSLSTVNQFNVPSSRIVLLKDVSHGGFTFFTNYASHKGKDIERNKHVSLLFFWKELQRQVRVDGLVELLSAEESVSYFKSRPRESQLASLASQQSEVIANRGELEDYYLSITKLYNNKEVPKPNHWGGYVVIPSKIEFWQGRASRLHDRIQYKLINNSWKIERLSP
jgi:pyridoxamine 5'-phosphate oxidase